jgi:uncharacterized protein YjhX (UPF0386 family)
MMKLLTGIFLLGSISSYATAEMKISESFLSSGEISALIIEPRYPGTGLPIRFDDWIKEDGVCKLLGYERAVPRSSIFSGWDQRVIMLDRNGNIEKLRNDTDSVTQIACINRLNNTSPEEKLEKIIEPRYPKTALPIRFDNWIKEDGVCKLLGYEKAVPGSSIFSGSYQRVIMLDGNGNIERLRNDTDRVMEIICSNRLNKTPTLFLKVVNNPVHPDSLIPLRFDDWYKEDGVCKLLGYESAVPRSSIFGGYEERVIMLNRNGNIEKLRNDTDSVTEIVCVKHF